MDNLIVALDVDDEVQAIDLCEELSSVVDIFKVGLELYLAEGDQIIQIIKELGKEVFLDLKLLDIPNTVKKACKVIAKKGVRMVTVHTLGGSAMLKAAMDGVKSVNPEKRSLVLGVTILTSLDQQILKNELNIGKNIEDMVMHLAKMAKDCGLDGVVCSAGEAKKIRKAVGDDFIIVTPGIRLKGEKASDQRRVYTPREATENGADFLVVGRGVINASDRLATAKQFLADLPS